MKVTIVRRRNLLLLTTVLLIAASGFQGRHVLFSSQNIDEVLQFNIRSVKSGNWSDPNIWQPQRTPKAGDRVLVGKGTKVVYDADSEEVIRMVHVSGKLSFARDRNTTLNVGLLKIHNDETCSESGFACTFDAPGADHKGHTARLEIGTPDNPMPASVTAKVRLHYQPGMEKNDAPALVCCAAHMDIHGAPLERTWLDLGKTAKPGDTTVVADGALTGWKAGDEIIITGSHRQPGRRFRNRPESVTTEERKIVKITGNTIHLNKALEHEHFGDGQFRSEVANLSRSVVIESADPQGLRGHTVYHRYSSGAISYARFAHLGKEGVLGRYPIHYHLVGTTMRGSYVKGVAIVDSHNRWVTIHGTQFLLVRDCVGYQSVGHGFFLEDGTEVYNVLDRNLGVQAYRGKRLPKQVLPFDPNDGAAFWWPNGRNTLVRNVACENEEYGFRYDCQDSRYFDSDLLVLMPDGNKKVVDIRSLAFYRFEDNEAHTEGLYGMVVATNGNRQLDSPIRSLQSLERFKKIDWTGSDERHPHIVKNLTTWKVHYALRPHVPNMWMENIRIHQAAYGIYRPAFDNHVYKNVHMSHVAAEPFNRGMDDASAQTGSITVDGLFFEDVGYGYFPLIQITDNNLFGDAECHFRNLKVTRKFAKHPLFGRGGGARADPVTKKGVPYYVHDYFGPGRHAKVVSDKAKDLLSDGNKYCHDLPFTTKDALVTEVKDVPWPKLLDPIDDLPPATIITSVRKQKGTVIVNGLSYDNGEIVSVMVNGRKATIVSDQSGIVDWQVSLDLPKNGTIAAHATDKAGNAEMMAHQVKMR